MLIERDLAHFDDILTLTAGTCIFTVTIICSRTKTTEFFIGDSHIKRGGILVGNFTLNP